ncbi:hypothetical protein Plhal304r1_c036g0110831 [Plasmopara halstedii]
MLRIIIIRPHPGGGFVLGLIKVHLALRSSRLFYFFREAVTVASNAESNCRAVTAFKAIRAGSSTSAPKR